jgi:hypothetical protein
MFSENMFSLQVPRVGKTTVEDENQLRAHVPHQSSTSKQPD